MQISDLIVEVRGPNFERVGQITPENLVGATFVSRFNNVGSWELRMPADAFLVDDVRTPGYGIVVSTEQGTLISGFTLSAQLEQTKEDPQGTWVIRGADDSLILSERLGYPTPVTADVTAQTVANDDRTGNAETVIKEYVSYNIGPDAPEERQIPNLLIEDDLERGPVVFGSSRFTQLQELLYGLATSAGLGYAVEQEESDLVFRVYEPIDRSADIRMDIANNRLNQADYSYSSPNATRLIIGGQGEAQDRVFYEGTTTDSLEAESVWLRRIEQFKDERNTEDADQFEQATLEALAENGKTIVNMSVSPADELSMQYGIDWNLGDQITVVINELEAVAVVSEVGISIASDGVRIAATVGNPVALDFESKLIAKTQTQDSRISNLERNTTGYGVNTDYQPEGGTSGTQPTFSGPVIFGSFNRFGNMVHFSILVDFDNISTFGSGQYYLTLPYPARVAYQFRDGCLHDDSDGTEFQMSGHVFAGEDVLWLNFADKVASGVQDALFTATTPITLTTQDSFHIAGTYEIGE